MALNIVSRSIDQAITETVQKRYFVGEDDILLNPNLTPILTMVTKVGNRRKAANASRVEWIEDDFYSVWGQVSNASAYSSVATSIVTVDGTIFQVGDLVAVPKADSSSAAEEVFRVTAVSTNTLTITRGIGGSGADTIGASDDLRVLGPAYAEGAAYGTPRSTSKVVQVSYTQIFREPVKITKSMVAQAQFGPSNERIFQRKKALESHRRSIESALLWSRASESLALPGTIRTTMGLKSRIATNTYNANTTLTESGFLTFAETAFKKYFQGRSKVLVSSPKVISALNFFSDGKLRVAIGETILGVSVQRYHSDHGEFLVVRDLNLEDGPVNATGWGDEAFAIDVDSIELAPLAGNGENRDTSLLENVIRDGTDVYADEWLTEIAAVIRFEKRHARLYNARAFA